MAESVSVPDVVDIKGYAGDTLTRSVTAPDALVAGREWLAQIKASRESDVVDAVFAITPPAVADGPAFLTLSAAETTRLVTELGTLRQVGLTAVYLNEYVGVWDCQVAAPGGTDPVTTLVQGKLTLVLDVTRTP